MGGACQVSGVPDDYVFEHPRNPKIVLVGLGYCSLYNHQAAAEATTVKRYVGGQLVITAAWDILDGEELTHDYGAVCVVGEAAAPQPHFLDKA